MVFLVFLLVVSFNIGGGSSSVSGTGATTSCAIGVSGVLWVEASIVGAAGVAGSASVAASAAAAALARARILNMSLLRGFMIISPVV